MTRQYRKRRVLTGMSRRIAAIGSGLLFAAVGVGLFMFLVMPVLIEWFTLRWWEPVPAELIEVRLQVPSGESGPRTILGRQYRYEFGGVVWTTMDSYLATRNDLSFSSRQVNGSPQERTPGTGRTVTLYVDPQQPDNAVMDRGLRGEFWSLVVVTLFCMVFAALGLFLLWIEIVEERVKATTASNGAKPWRPRKG